MGRQIRFYALPKDEMMFLEFVRSFTETYRVSSKSPDSSIVSFILPWSTDLPEPVFRDFYLGKGNINGLEPFIRKGSKKVYSEIKKDYLETGERFFWIDMSAPLVEFTPSFFRDDGRLTQGRIWADFIGWWVMDLCIKGTISKPFLRHWRNGSGRISRS